MTLLRVRRAVAATIAAAVLLLAVIAGRWMFGTWDIQVHGYLGNVVFLLALVNLGLTLAAKPTGSEFALSGMIALLVFTQIGLGYVGRDEPEAAAWHVPNGVLLMALSAYQYAQLRMLPAR